MSCLYSDARQQAKCHREGRGLRYRSRSRWYPGTGDTFVSSKDTPSSWINGFPELGNRWTGTKSQNQPSIINMARQNLAEEDQLSGLNLMIPTRPSSVARVSFTLEIIDRLRREFKVECKTRVPQVSYKEALTAAADHTRKVEKQSGWIWSLASDVIWNPSALQMRNFGKWRIQEWKTNPVCQWHLRRFGSKRIPRIHCYFNAMMDNGILAGLQHRQHESKVVRWTDTRSG